MINDCSLWRGRGWSTHITCLKLGLSKTQVFFPPKINQTKQTKCLSTSFPEGLLFSKSAVIFPACKGVSQLPKFKLLLHFVNYRETKDLVYHSPISAIQVGCSLDSPLLLKYNARLT